MLSGPDSNGCPPERSDHFHVALFALVSAAAFEREGADGGDNYPPDDSEFESWAAVRACLKSARAAVINPAIVALGWGRGRLLLMELLRSGQLARVAGVIDDEVRGASAATLDAVAAYLSSHLYHKHHHK